MFSRHSADRDPLFDEEIAMGVESAVLTRDFVDHSLAPVRFNAVRGLMAAAVLGFFVWGLIGLSFILVQQ